MTKSIKTFIPRGEIEDLTIVSERKILENHCTKVLARLDFGAIFTLRDKDRDEFLLNEDEIRKMVKQCCIERLIDHLKFFFYKDVVKELENIEIEISALPTNEATASSHKRVVTLIKNLKVYYNPVEDGGGNKKRPQ